MEYNRKTNVIEIHDCEFEKTDTLDALHEILKPAIANTRLQFFKICMNSEQYKWYKKQVEKEDKKNGINTDPNAKLYYEGREVVEKQ